MVFLNRPEGGLRCGALLIAPAPIFQLSVDRGGAVSCIGIEVWASV
jgi:hypothetical protein